MQTTRAIFLGTLLFNIFLSMHPNKTISLINPKKNWISFFNTIKLFYPIDTFVESGTYLGQTALQAAQCFSNVHTIEVSTDYYQQAVELFKNHDHVMVYHGDSAKILPQLLPQLKKQKKKILTWDDTRVDNKKYFKYFFVQSNLEMIDELVPLEDKKLCTLIGGNKNFRHRYELYSQRRAAIAFFERHAPKDFDFYGHGWNPKIYKTYRGPVKSKTDTFKKYKFSICYENISHQKGYITEKIFGSFIAGCVPVYWGADNITDYIPENCFIDKRKFTNLSDLYKFISTMKEEDYNKYLKNIKAFLTSREMEKYSIDSFVETLASINCYLLQGA